MSADERRSAMSLPASLILSRPPRFAVYDQFGVRLEVNGGLDPLVDPVVFVETRDTAALLRWGERHAASILVDDSIALWERQFFLQRGLMMQAVRLLHHRGKFKRLSSLVEVTRHVSRFLVGEPGTYQAVLSMTPAAYSPSAHAVGTGLLTSALMGGSGQDGAVDPDSLVEPLLAGMMADVGLVDLNRNLLSFEETSTPPERELLHAHPHASALLIRRFGVESEALLDAVEYHHERIDGSGYPLGLGGGDIPRLAQCVGLAETFMTLITDLPRCAAVPPAAAIELLSDDAFDPELVATLATVLRVGDAAHAAETAA